MQRMSVEQQYPYGVHPPPYYGVAPPYTVPPPNAFAPPQVAFPANPAQNSNIIMVNQPGPGKSGFYAFPSHQICADVVLILMYLLCKIYLKAKSKWRRSSETV